MLDSCQETDVIAILDQIIIIAQIYRISKMGQHPAPGKLIPNWYQSQTQPDVICNKYTKDQYQRHYVLIQDKRQLEWYDRRMKEHYPYICRVVCYHTADFTPNENKQQNDHQQSQSKTYFVYTDRMLPIQAWTIDTSLCILKGFNRLITNQNYQYFQIENNMIGQNEHGIVKVWVNSNPASNSVYKTVSSEEQMLANIAGILMKNDKYSASLLINCKTFKQAIKNVSKRKLDDAHFSQMYSCREDIKKQQKKEFIYEKKDQHPNWHIGQPNQIYLGKTNMKNNQFWTIRNNHDDRQYISQGKRQVSNLIDMINQNRNASSTTKNNPGSLQRPSLQPPNYNIYQANNPHQNSGHGHIYGSNLGNQPNSHGYPVASITSPKGKEGYEFLQANLDKKNQNNKFEYNQKQKNYKIQHKGDKNSTEPNKFKQEKALELAKAIQQRKKYTSTYLQKMQQKEHFNQDGQQLYAHHIHEMQENDETASYSPINTNYRPKNTPNSKKTYIQGQFKGIFYEDPNRISTYDNIHDAFKYQEINTQRNKTQDFQKQHRSDVPSFIPKKKEQYLGDNTLGNPLNQGKTYSVSGKQDNYEKIQKKKSEALQQVKKQVKSQKRAKKLQSQQEITQKKQQRPSAHKIVQSKSKRFINNIEDARNKITNLQNQQKQEKKPVNLVLPSSSHKTSGSQQFANQKKNNSSIGQSMSKSSGECNKNTIVEKDFQKKKYNDCESFGEQQEDYEKQIEDKRKIKQQRNIQWKKQFGSILCLDSQQTPKKGEVMYKSGNFVQPNSTKQKRNATQKYGPTNQGSKKEITLTSSNNKKNKNQKQSPSIQDQQDNKIDIILNNLSTDNSQAIRDKMIKQKVQRKKADFADLKQRAMKILY